MRVRACSSGAGDRPSGGIFDHMEVECVYDAYMPLPAPDFADGADLYEILGVDDKAAHADIRRAYRRLALQYHPDKAGGNAESNHRFQQIGFAYSVLSDDARRARYDATGSTEESFFEGPVDWNEYFRTLWTGEVSAQTLNEFQAKYRGSDEERQDVIHAYRDAGGRLERIFASVPCANILEDEQRFIDMIDHAIGAGELERTRAWERVHTPKGLSARKNLRRQAKREATEAEEYAKELGVYDQLFGKQGEHEAGPTSEKETKGKEKGKRKEKSKSKGPTASSMAPADASDAPEDDTDVDLSGLRAAMAAKAGKRESAFDDMISRLEARHTDKRRRT